MHMLMLLCYIQTLVKHHKGSLKISGSYFLAIYIYFSRKQKPNPTLTDDEITWYPWILQEHIYDVLLQAHLGEHS